MSKFLSDAAITEFDSEVKHAYQGAQTLRQTVSVRTGVKGEAYKFTRMGKGIANQKASQADVTPMDITHSRQTANIVVKGEIREGLILRLASSMFLKCHHCQS